MEGVLTGGVDQRMKFLKIYFHGLTIGDPGVRRETTHGQAASGVLARGAIKHRRVGTGDRRRRGSIATWVGGGRGSHVWMKALRGTNRTAAVECRLSAAWGVSGWVGGARWGG